MGIPIIFFLYITYNFYEYETIFPEIITSSIGNRAYIVFFIFALAIPFLFFATKNFKIDRFLGNLSYSIYIFQLMIIDQCKLLTPFLGEKISSLHSATIIGAIFVSICIYFIIEKPMEVHRKKRVDNALRACA